MPGPAEPSTPLQELGELPGRIAATFQSLQAASTVSFGASEKDAVYREDKLTLYHYRPIAASANLPPVLIVYALVNRPYMMDLQPDRSLIRRLLELGLDLYLIDWGYPDGADRFTDLNDYINGYMHRCLDVVLREHHLDSTTVLGVCQGGTFSLCYTALHPERVRNLITMVTPVDFQTSDNLLQLIQPLLDLYAKQDPLVPPTASPALESLVGSKDYLALGLDVGHIGMYVSGRAQRELPQAIVYWLQRR